ncbi:hypothetical protein KY317_01655 [Candidatus Woesearchaeota archaeon]|nr:hypothetical protein [Candidatus Woesearchaeota archaeon]
MVRKKYSNNWSELEIPEWEEHFQQRGIREIPYFNGTVFSKAKDAAYFFAEQGIHDFSGIELAVITSLDEWGKDNAHRILSVLYAELSRHYKTDYYEEIEELQMPAIHLLRIETKNYKGNLHACKGYEINSNGKIVAKISEPIYEITISCEDWQEGLRLPLPDEYDFKTAKLFGFYWGLGSLVSSGRNSTDVLLSGKESVRNLLEREVMPLMGTIHGIRIREYDQKDEKKIILGDSEVDLNGYSIYKASMALVSFLSNEHRFPLRKSKRKQGESRRIHKNHLPNIPWTDETIDGFVLGLIKSRGNDTTYFYKRDKYPDVYIESLSINGEGRYVDELSELLTKREHMHSISKRKECNKRGYWTVNFNKNAVLHFRRLMENSSTELVSNFGD